MNSIFLVDGLDEVHSSSEELVEDILDFLKDHEDATCIFTTRPLSVMFFFLRKASYERAPLSDS